MKLKRVCNICNFDIVYTEHRIDVLGECKSPDECAVIEAQYVNSGLAEKDYNLLMMLFPTPKDRVATCKARWFEHTREALTRLAVPHTLVVNKDTLKVTLNADPPHHVQI